MPVSRSFPYKPWEKTFSELQNEHLAALEAARLTSTAEPDATTAVPMSGGAEPAGAANHHE